MTPLDRLRDLKLPFAELLGIEFVPTRSGWLRK
jgi:hypothetical protein